MHLLRVVYHLDLFEERDAGGEHEMCRRYLVAHFVGIGNMKDHMERSGSVIAV
jgi:hypothetical protein